MGPLTSVATSNHYSYDLTFYGEAGFDYPGSLVLNEPFLGIEAWATGDLMQLSQVPETLVYPSLKESGALQQEGLEFM